MPKKRVWFGLFFFMAMASAFADQAVNIEKTDAYKAAEMINSGMAMRKYCPPCGDTAWTEVAVKQVEVKDAGDQLYALFVNIP